MSFWSRLFGGGKDRDTAKAADEHDLVVNAMIRTMAFVAASDGEIEDEEVAQIAKVYEIVMESAIDVSVVRGAINVARQDTSSLEQYLSDLAHKLSDDSKALIIEAAIRTAASDGEYEEPEKKLINHIATCLGFSPEKAQALADSLH